MTEFIPYFAGFVTLMFGVGFYAGLQELKKQVPIKRKDEENNSSS